MGIHRNICYYRRPLILSSPVQERQECNFCHVESASGVNVGGRVEFAHIGRPLHFPLRKISNICPVQHPLAVSSQKEVISLHAIQTNPFIPFAINSLYLGRTENVATLLGMMGVRYIVVDLSAPDFPWAPFQHTTRAYAFLSKAPGL